MAKIEAKNIEMLSKKTADAVFEQLESGIHHTPYESETAFYNCIESGDTEELEKIMETYMTQSIVVGRMSNNELKQMQYFAVCCIALATRSAIRGGLSEITAFNLSDEYIRTVDSLNSTEQIPAFLSEKAFELTALVRKNGERKSYPEVLRKAVYFIDSHLYQKTTPADIAVFCRISKDHLNVLFRNNTKKTTGAYITCAKLRESKRLLRRGLNNSEIAYLLCFCSESYYIDRFKKEYGITPGDYRSSSISQ